MASILICTVGVLSHINTLLGVAKRLKRSEHDIRFLVQRPHYIGILSGRAYEVFCVASIADSKQSHQQTLIHDEIGPARCLERIKPDLVLVDAEWHEVIFQSLKVNLKTIGLEFHCSPDRWPNVPPLNSEYIPSSSFLSPIRCQIEWRKSLGRRRKRGVVDKQIKHLAMTVGEPEQTIHSITTFDHWQPLRFNDIDYWCLTAEQFDYPHIKSGVSKYVGPCIAYERKDDKGDARFESWFENTIANATHERLIYASLGSLVHEKTWIEQIIAAARIRTNWTWLIATGSETASTQFSGLLSNVHITQSVPQLRVLNYADVMLAGAGIATIHECIFTRTPIVAHSLSVLDQNGNATRVSYHGIGQTSRPGPDSAAKLVERINDLSNNKKYAKQMAVYKTYIEDYDSQQVLENEVDRILNGVTTHG